MAFQFGKAVFGGTPVTDADVRQMSAERLHKLKEQLARPERTHDVLDQRLAEELAYTQRLLETAEHELKRRGAPAGVVNGIAEAETVIEDIAGVVEAKDRCAGVEVASPAVKRRLARGAIDGDRPVCRR